MLPVTNTNSSAARHSHHFRCLQC